MSMIFFSEQPAVNNTFGAVLTIGVNTNGNRAAIVLPVFTTDITLGKVNLCDDAVNSAVTTLVPLMVIVMVATDYISFVQADGMKDGYIPSRQDFAPGANPGLVTGQSLPSQTSVLLSMYEEPDDSIAGKRMRVAKTFMPSVPAGYMTNGQLDPTHVANYDSIVSMFGAGWPGVNDVTKQWFRGLSVPKPRSTTAQVPRIRSGETRQYVGTQRRRLVPKG